MMKCEMNSKSI